MDNQRDSGSAGDHFKRLIKKLSRPTAWPEGALQVPKAQAHRGSQLRGAKENTIQAFVDAKNMGATMCELDVRLTRDRIPVVFHDESIERFSERKDLIAELTFEDLNAIFEVPSLQQVLTHASLLGMKFNIEIKSDRAIEDALERKVFQVIQKTASESRVMVSSFNPLSLWRFSLHTKKIPMCLLVGHGMKEKYLEEMWFAPFITFHALNLDEKLLLDNAEVHFWRSQGVPICVWTLNDLERAQELLEHGVLSIISDKIMHIS